MRAQRDGFLGGLYKKNRMKRQTDWHRTVRRNIQIRVMRIEYERKALRDEGEQERFELRDIVRKCVETELRYEDDRMRE
ncbi:hypothetical protein NDU88_003891 [Pleurodeles waltl]|uniref:Uncharacterized protein n=1 Tax=Pleurodeles waltl TaxID=8319 RepID=A0AAV7UHQ8_PLEWA|nr:hypothetical protein NDU88_003891 [Pleurodeles waltl]